MKTKLAQGIVNPLLNENLQKESGVSYFQKLLPKLVTLSLIVGVLIFVFMLLTGAVQWISSSGDKAAVEAARGKIANALIGLVILFSVFAVIKLIEAFFSINLLELNIGALKIS